MSAHAERHNPESVQQRQDGQYEAGKDVKAHPLFVQFWGTVYVRDLTLKEVEECNDDGYYSGCEYQEVAFDGKPLWSQQFEVVDGEEG